MIQASLPALLSANSYPGRGIVLGRSPDGASAVAVYFIMGRSENSRNRVFVPTEDGIRTQARDPEKMTDPSLVIYHPIRDMGNCLIVTNGDQTDTIRDALADDSVFRAPDSDASLLRSDLFRTMRRIFDTALETRAFEPDPPHHTPRISGILTASGFALSILKSADGDPACCCRYTFSYDCPLPGEGRFLHTYQGDGNPLPSFTGEPVRVKLDAADPDTLARTVWDALDPDNRVSLFVRFWTPGTGQRRDALINRHGSGTP